MNPENQAPKKRRGPSKPWGTVVLPYLDQIHEMRRRTPPLSYRKISRELKRLHDLDVAHNTIMKAVNARKKERKVANIHPSFLSRAAPKGSISKPRANSSNQKPDSEWDKLLEINGPLTK